MIPAEVIDAFPLGMINVHASLLPKLRGAAPIIRAIMNGDSLTGVTIMRIMPEKFDIGEILAQEEIPIHPDETMPELYTKLAKLGSDLLIKTVEKLPDVLHQGREQNSADATYAPKITAKASVIRWNKMSAQNVYNLQRALTGLYSLTTKFEGIAIKLHGIRVYEEPVSLANSDEEKPGCVFYDKKKNLLLIQCKDNTWISVDEIVVPGRRAMSGKDFRNGFMSKYKESLIIFH
ncbi:methionyl-tRNA formyltransferase, mitochondrial isoform X2 [Venturia canescens]|nr:methionyl-tRNA formyltransferase, mitochondrial isoform X2 [Venturia canescens]